MLGTEYLPQPGDRLLVLARGGIIVANAARPPFVIHADGTREDLSFSGRPDGIPRDPLTQAHE